MIALGEFTGGKLWPEGFDHSPRDAAACSIVPVPTPLGGFCSANTTGVQVLRDLQGFRIPERQLLGFQVVVVFCALCVLCFLLFPSVRFCVSGYARFFVCVCVYIALLTPLFGVCGWEVWAALGGSSLV